MNISKQALTLLTFFLSLCLSCENKHNSKTETGEYAEKTTADKALNSDLVVGGLYCTRDSGTSYSLSKILAMDAHAVHVRMYDNKLGKIPTSIDSDTLNVLIGHAPLAKKGFLIDNPKLIKVEKVKDSELEGYKMYLDAMKN
jgi:hypothetical protein